MTVHDLDRLEQENDALQAERDQLKHLLDEVVARSILTADELDLMEPPSHAATQAVSRLARDWDAAASILADNDLGIHDTLTLPLSRLVQIDRLTAERDQFQRNLEAMTQDRDHYLQLVTVHSSECEALVKRLAAERDRLRYALEKFLDLSLEYSGYYLLDVGADVGAVFSPGIEAATAALKGA